MDEQASRTLVLFDFDGTLFELATDYPALRDELESLAREANVDSEGGFVTLIAQLEASIGPRVGDAVDRAEAAGLAAGTMRPHELALYRDYRERGARLAIVSHNGRAVIEAFLAQTGLPPPDAILDRSDLGGFKEESRRVPEYVASMGVEDVIVVGDSEHDERLARKLGAKFIQAGAGVEWR